jgi:hypothetical protein
MSKLHEYQASVRAWIGSLSPRLEELLLREAGGALDGVPSVNAGDILLVAVVSTGVQQIPVMNLFVSQQPEWGSKRGQSWTLKS